MLYIIVTYQGEQYIRKCIESIKQHDPTSEIWVFDNGSKDSTLSILSDLGIPYHSSTQNLGFGAANNIGLSYFLSSNHSHCFLLNQDAYLNESIKNIPEAINNHSHAILAPIQLTGDGKKFDFAFRQSYLQHKLCPEFHEDVYFNRIKTAYNIRFAPAAAWILPRSVIQTIGGFNPSFFHYGEDDNYVDRCKYHGIGLKLIPAISVLHDRSARTQPITPKMIQQKAKRQILIQTCNPANHGTGWKLKFKTSFNFLPTKTLTIREINDALKNKAITKTKGPHFIPLHSSSSSRKTAK